MKVLLNSSIHVVTIIFFLFCDNTSHSFSCFSPNRRLASLSLHHQSTDRVEAHDGTSSLPTLNTKRRQQQRLQRLINHSNPTISSGSKDVESKKIIPCIDKDITSNSNYNNHKSACLIGEGYISDNVQNRAIQSNAPAILLDSGPGTGKTQTLAGELLISVIK